MKDMMERPRPTRLLIAALGGEGGGVLAGWITEAAVASGLAASRTSIPGVAQRTGATTYYIEMVATEPGAPPPVLALNPAPGEVDVVLASEMLEAARLAGAGLISADRTALIANRARVLTMDEKMATGDGQVDPARLERVLRQASRTTVLADLATVAVKAGAPLSAVLAGALAGLAIVPISADALRAAIRQEGKAVDRNLAGFEAGLRAVSEPSADAATPVKAVTGPAPIAGLPSETSRIAALGAERLTDYQHRAYAETYLTLVRDFAALPGVDDALAASFARRLAVRMSVEDVIRVAQLKLRESCLARVAAEARARPGDIVDITEFMKPGAEEMCGLLPPMLGRGVFGLAKRAGLGKAAIPMTVRTTRVSGYARLKLLAALKWWRPHTLKFSDECAWRNRWLAAVRGAVSRSPAAAAEVIAMADLVRGYGETYARGLAAYDRISVALIEPVLAANAPPAGWSERLLQARLAAEKDPDGALLTRTLSAIASADNARAATPEHAAQ